MRVCVRYFLFGVPKGFYINFWNFVHDMHGVFLKCGERKLVRESKEENDFNTPDVVNLKIHRACHARNSKNLYKNPSGPQTQNEKELSQELHKMSNMKDTQRKEIRIGE